MQVIFNHKRQHVVNDPTAIALGTFDGIHLGHRKLISKLHEQKKLNGYRTMVYTFLGHPLERLNPSKVPPQIMLLGEKIKGFSSLGIDTLVLNPFTDEFLHQTPEVFIDSLLTHYNIKSIIVGFNFRFGYKGQGDIGFLEKAAQDKGFDLICVPPVQEENTTISSTLIRDLITKGNLEEAAMLLEKPYSIKGRIVHGYGRGRSIGFPTANLSFSNKKVLPCFGVYLTRCYINNQMYWGVTSVGKNPTFAQDNINIEAYIFDLNKDIYGSVLRIEFIRYLREEIKFNTVEELIHQIGKDVVKAKNLIYNYL